MISPALPKVRFLGRTKFVANQQIQALTTKLLNGKFGSQNHRSPEPPKGHVIIQLNLPDWGRISKEMIEFWQKGCSLNEISTMTRMSRARVRAILHRNGIFTRPKIDESKVIAWRKRRRTQAHPPFGFTYYIGKLVIEPREHEILLVIERLTKDGLNPNAIPEYLNAKNLKPRRALKWNRNSVVLILRRNEESI